MEVIVCDMFGKTGSQIASQIKRQFPAIKVSVEGKEVKLKLE